MEVKKRLIDIKDDKETKLLNNYYGSKAKRKNDITELEKNLFLFINTSRFLKENPKDEKMAESRDFVKKLSYYYYKEMKKDDIAISEAKEYIFNSLRDYIPYIEKKEEQEESIFDSLKEFHEEADELVASVIDMAPIEIKQQMLQTLESKNLTKTLLPKLRNK